MSARSESAGGGLPFYLAVTFALNSSAFSLLYKSCRSTRFSKNRALFQEIREPRLVDERIYSVSHDRSRDNYSAIIIVGDNVNVISGNI